MSGNSDLTDKEIFEMKAELAKLIEDFPIFDDSDYDSLVDDIFEFFEERGINVGRQ